MSPSTTKGQKVYRTSISVIDQQNQCAMSPFFPFPPRAGVGLAGVGVHLARWPPCLPPSSPMHKCPRDSHLRPASPHGGQMATAKGKRTFSEKEASLGRL